MSAKMCFISSSGGHLEEVMQLKSLFNENSYLIVERTDIPIPNEKVRKYYIPQINRKEFLFLPKLLFLFLYSVYNILKEKPKVIISTGALCSFPMCLIGKILGKKIIFIESFARVYDKSLTGSLIYKFADLFIVQWEEMLELYPKAVYGGGIFK